MRQMKQVYAPKRDNMTLVIPVPVVGRGHCGHRSGVGCHFDRRNRRLRTRKAQFRAATDTN